MLLSTIENPVPHQFEPVSLKILLESVVREFGPKFSQKEVTLQAHLPEEVRTVGDSHSLERMISNLLENALRYTEKNGKVAVNLRNDGNKLEVVIEDTGIGIPPESLTKIFDRFYRVDSSRSRRSGGVGLGLAIAKAIAQAHHGQILVESTVGTGSRFIVVLPLA